MIENLVRENIKNLKPYTSARDIYSEGILLDANENSFGSAAEINGTKFNRYPDPHQKEMRKILSEYLGLSYKNLFFGVGSDEIIDLLIRIFCIPGKDSILSAEPTYGMYKVSADINDVKAGNVLLNENFDIDVDSVLSQTSENTKIIFLCSPNNPTGNLLSKDRIEYLLQKSNSIIVVDEAYIDFAGEDNSCKNLISKYRNLVILRTFSKAWGLAGIRLGYCIADEEIISYLFKIKAPYNINALTKMAFTLAMLNLSIKDNFIKEILSERNYLVSVLKQFKSIIKIYPSEANYILIRINEATLIQKLLAEKGIIVRDRSTQPMLDNCLRITIGTRKENVQFLNALKSILINDEKTLENFIEAADFIPANLRHAVVVRTTKETSISVKVSLDSSEESSISTGIGFFDHMLAQIARHGNMYLEIKTTGDLYVDEHHTVEDTGLALGAAISEALGSKSGIQRYGFFLPMDDSVAYCTIDLGGRIYLNFNAKFQRETVGNFPTELTEEFFRAIASGLKANIYIKASGKNDHHKIEAIFKSFAKALNEACRLDERVIGLPSTKGIL
ncbi:MAG: histidinol-phosphate transaminase [Methanococcaceae archaeon]